MHGFCENPRTDKNFPLFTLGWAILISAVISVEQRWCNAINEEGSYSFSYVIDTDGIVSQHNEHRQFNVTRGSYSFLQPDGQIRVVQYQVDTNGFRATVKFRKISGTLEGHLRYPKDFFHPVILAVPVGLITEDLFQVKKKYPNLPH